MRILVTGSNGFIASSLVDKLIELGHEVVGLDIAESQHRKPSRTFTPLIGDITNPKLIDSDYGGEDWWSDIDFCFHLAAMANVDEVREFREKAFQVNVHGTFNVADVCRKYNIPLAFASTACCYGHTTQHPSTEDGPTVPVDLYGITKRAGEEIVKGLVKKYVILRFGTTYGPKMRDALCTYIFLRQAMNGEKFTVKGDGEQSRNFIYIDDLVDGCIKAMEYLTSPQGTNEVFNLVGAVSWTIHELAAICLAVSQEMSRMVDFIKPCCVYLPEREDDVIIEDISIAKATKLLKWFPQINLYKGLERIHREWKEGADNPAT